MKMLGRKGWHGQCACCCGRDNNKQIKRQETNEWRKDFEDEELYPELEVDE